MTTQIANAETWNTPFSRVAEQAAKVTLNRFQYGPAEPQVVEYQLAENALGSIIFIHGGCWLNVFGVDHVRGVAGELANRGWNSYAVEYRRVGDQDATWPAPIADVNAAITQILTTHKNQGTSKGPVWLVGHSAGGHLALLAGASFQQELTGVIGLAPITDLTKYAAGTNSCEQVTPKLVPTKESAPEFYQQWSPVNRTVHSNTHQFVGGADFLVSQTQHVDAWPKQVFPQAGHFDFLNIHSPAFEQWVALINASTQP